MVHHQTVDAARRNGKSSGQFRAPNGATMNGARLIDLLVASAGTGRHAAIRVGANQLLARLARGAWRVAAAPHKGGTGGRAGGADENLHVTVHVGGRGYHLQLDARGHAWRITGPGITAVAPWSGPGA